MRGVPLQLPTVEYLRECVSYNPSTGRLIWLQRPAYHFRTEAAWKGVNTQRAGKEADAAKDLWGYRVVGVSCKIIKAHRLIWKLIMGRDPVAFLDHINGDRADNRIDNLREATKAENAFNKGVVRARSGFKGVNKPKPTDTQWLARISKGKQRLRLGWFPTKEEAHAAYVRASREMFGEFATAGREHVAPPSPGKR